MKFIHLADLHLGKIIYQRSLIEIQADLLNQVMNYMNKNDIHTLVMAGDIYDRAIASQESIAVLNDFLDQMINVYHHQVIMISGNHDSSERMNFGSSLLKSQGLYIASYPQKQLQPIEIEDVNFYLVPFFKPSYMRYLYQNDDLKTYQDAFSYYLQQQYFDTSKPCVLVTHQFFAGNQDVIRSESEVTLTVGGSEIIDVDLLEHFDYVALGHLHASQKVKYDHVRYAGSLMKYSFDEVNQTKGMVEVTIDENGVLTQIIPLKPQKDFVKLKGRFEDVMHYEDNQQDFISIELLDKQIVGHAFERLKEKFPDLLQITYALLDNLSTHQKTAATEIEKQTPVELFIEFYEKMKGEKPILEEIDIVEKLLKEDDEHDAT